MRSAFDIRSLLSSFEEKARSCFLFTEHIRKLEAVSRYDTITNQPIWTVICAKSADQDLHRNISGGSTLLSQVVIQARCGAKHTTEEWSVYKLRVPADSIPRVNYQKLRLRAEISVGIAVFRDMEKPGQGSSTPSSKPRAASSLFAILPLPISSSLPFTVHGDFILSQDRSAVRLHSDDCPDQAEYNKYLLQNLLPKLLLVAIAIGQAEQGGRARYLLASIWPKCTSSAVEEALVKSFYADHLVKTNECVISDYHGNLICPSSAVFLRQTRTHVSRQILLAAGIDGICNNIPFQPSLLPDDQWRELQTDSVSCLVAAMRGNPTGLLQSFKAKKLTIEVLASVLNLILNGAQLPDDELKKLKIVPLASGELAYLPLESDSPLYCAGGNDMRVLREIASQHLVLPNFIEELANERLLVGQGSMKRVGLAAITKAAFEELLQQAIPKLQKIASTASVVKTEWLEHFWSTSAVEHQLSPSSENLRELPLLPIRRSSDNSSFVISSAACGRLPIIDSHVPDHMREHIFVLPHLYIMGSSGSHRVLDNFSVRQLLDAFKQLSPPELSQIFASSTFSRVAQYICAELESTSNIGHYFDVNQLRTLPIWPATKGNGHLLLQPTAFTLLPSGITGAQARTFLSDNAEYIETTSNARYNALVALGLQPLSISSVLTQFSQRTKVSAAQMPDYLQLVIGIYQYHSDPKTLPYLSLYK